MTNHIEAPPYDEFRKNFEDLDEKIPNGLFSYEIVDHSERWKQEMIEIEKFYPNFKSGCLCCIIDDWESHEPDYADRYRHLLWVTDEPHFETEGFLDRYRNGEDKEELLRLDYEES